MAWAKGTRNPPPPGFAASAEWHAKPIEAVARRAESSVQKGLSQEESKRRLQAIGPNVIERARGAGPLSILARQLHNSLVYILLAATLLAFFLGKITDGIVVLGVVILNTLIGFVQEYQAGQAIQALSALVPENATVLRDGAQKEVPSAELVIGDVVLLGAGDRISADLRLFSVKNLQCDESALTGESVPSSKSTEPVPRDAPMGDRHNMAWSGTLVTAGTGAGLVVTTGSRTEFGRISALLARTHALRTPLLLSLERMARWITAVILLTSALLFGFAVLRGDAPLDAGFSAVTLAVAAIPEGLPAIITIASAVGVRRMARRRAIVRHLSAVETLGSTTVICSDKTGTLTKNEMVVESLWTPLGETRPTDVLGERREARLAFEGLLRAAVLAGDASLSEDEGRERAVGDPTEAALVLASLAAGQHERTMRVASPRLDVVPFDSERKIMATLHRTETGGAALYLKGAPEVVLPRCDDAPSGAPAEAERAAHRFAAEGRRVIAVARKDVAPERRSISEGDLDGRFELLGLEAMLDPPRDEARDAISACRSAGILVKMITGDHPGTAVSIARALGITDRARAAVTGGELDAMSEDAWAQAAREVQVFARVSPEHKLRLVEALQRQGFVVAMTGDGVNDAPALKRADIGVAMGISGTAVAKEAADVILTDDNFATIEAAVEEGRRVYDNLIKAIAFVLPTSVGLGLLVLLAILFFPVADGVILRPVEPVQVLWVNLVTGVSLAVPLAFEAMEPDVMRRPPRRKTAPILSRLLVFRTLFVGALMAGGTIGLFLWEYDAEVARGTAPEVAYREAQTMAVTAIVLFQVFYLLNCRSLSRLPLGMGALTNPLIFLGILVTILAQIAFVYVPYLTRIFHSAPVKLDAWALSLAVAFVVFPVVTFETWLRARVRGRPEAVPEGRS